MTTTPADPGAIDLDDLVKLLRIPHKGEKGYYHRIRGEAADAIAALRGRAVELEANPAFLGDMRKAQRQLVTALENKAAAEARVVELEGVLQEIAMGMNPSDKLLKSGPAELFREMLKWSQEKARTVLAVIPAEALERARAVEDVMRLARDGLETGFGAKAQRELDMALAKLDDLDKEEGP